MTIVELLAHNAEQFPDEVALVEVDYASAQRKHEASSADGCKAVVPLRREMLWREFYAQANQLANLLLSLGYQRGDKVAILLMNSLEWLPTYFGILAAGLTAVPLNYRETGEEIQYCLQKADCRALVFSAAFTERIDGIRHQLQNIQTMLFVGEDCPPYAKKLDAALATQSTNPPAVVLTEDDDAAIYFSSGTTGLPKAILHPHRSLYHAAVTEQKHHGQSHEDIFLCIPPLYHTGAKMHWFGSLLVGGKAVLLKGVRPQWILQTVAEERCSIVWLLVPWAQDILDCIERGEYQGTLSDLASWRLMHIGAQPVPPALIRRWLSVFPHHQYDTNYGLSESTGPGCVHLGLENTHKVGAIGKAGYGWEVRIVDDNGTPVAQGEVGELCVKGPAVMKCYYNDAKATQGTVRDGWLFTGDIVKADEDGFIYLVDRKKDVIISGGENIYPVQIEAFLRGHSAIRDVAVIGYPDARLGEIACAVIATKPNARLTEEEVNAYCEALPHYKRPRKIVFAEVPRNPTGKIEKPLLREKYCKP